MYVGSDNGIGIYHPPSQLSLSSKTTTVEGPTLKKRFQLLCVVAPESTLPPDPVDVRFIGRGIGVTPLYLIPFFSFSLSLL